MNRKFLWSVVIIGLIIIAAMAITGYDPVGDYLRSSLGDNTRPFMLVVSALVIIGILLTSRKQA